jgi:protein-tyrosine phosphatase
MKASPPEVLFLCTGNYFRSRFAEILFNHRAAALGLSHLADSRGLAVDLVDWNVGPISAYALQGLELRGIPPGDPLRYPIQLRESDLLAARRVIAVKEAEHRPLLDRRFPGWCGRVEFWHVDDIDCARPEDALALLEREVEQLLRRLGAETRASRPRSAAG